MHTGKLVVLGSVNADHILSVNHFPRPGETLTGHAYQVVFGGKGANQAVAAGRLGANVSFIACVGEDDIGARMREQFVRDGVDVQGVMRVPGMNTGVAMIFVSAHGENSIGIAAEANAALTPDRLQPHLDLIRDADALLMQLETPLDTIMAAASAARAAGTTVILNPAPAHALPDSLLAQVDIITPNETEAECLTGIKIDSDADAARAAAMLHGKGIRTVLITLGARGVWCSEQGHQGVLIPGFRVQALDTTAAGDTFNAAFVTAMLEQKPLAAAIRFAHAAAALSVTRFGAQPSIPWRNETDYFLQQQPTTAL
ncbi:ribokinase [Plesiomonas shigelloides]|uniref:ribokinase n=1 Tax=Plesiomonas shigelloides TaxID=703 RepID=UPI000D56E20B|nr:ribokinase [Plesiomonas shigelloides]PVU66191.1 ribokinase [Plesiomonas shigelloides]